MQGAIPVAQLVFKDSPKPAPELCFTLRSTTPPSTKRSQESILGQIRGIQSPLWRSAQGLSRQKMEQVSEAFPINELVAGLHPTLNYLDVRAAPARRSKI